MNDINLTYVLVIALYVAALVGTSAFLLPYLRSQLKDKTTRRTAMGCIILWLVYLFVEFIFFLNHILPGALK